MLSNRFDATTAAQIALPPQNHQPCFSDAEAAKQNPIAKFLICEACAALSHWLLLTKNNATLCKIDYTHSLTLLRVSMSTLPFQVAHEKSFGWLRGLAADLPVFKVPVTLFEEMHIGMDLSYKMSHHAHDYTARLCQDIGSILYDCADEIETEIAPLFKLSVSDCEEIKETYLRYISFAMEEFSLAMRAPQPYLVAYPYSITRPAMPKHEKEEVSALAVDEFEIFEMSYIPTVESHCVWDARREAYLDCAIWKDGCFKELFADSANAFPTATADFFDVVRDKLYRNSSRDDFEEMASFFKQDDDTEESLAEIVDEIFEDPFYPELDDAFYDEELDDESACDAVRLDDLDEDDFTDLLVVFDLDEDLDEELDEDDFDEEDEPEDIDPDALEGWDESLYE